MTTVVVQDAKTANGAAEPEAPGPDSGKDELTSGPAAPQAQRRARGLSAAKDAAAAAGMTSGVATVPGTGPWAGQAMATIGAQPSAITPEVCDAVNRAWESAYAALKAAEEHRNATLRERRAGLLLELAHIDHLLGNERDPRTAEGMQPAPSAPPARRRRRQAPKARGEATGAPTGRVARAKGKRRLARRSAEALAETLASIVGACKRAGKAGLRAEQLRVQLKLDRRELPRVLRMGVTSRKLRAKGRKRATTYYAR